jgi:sugar lactone lactonase YvrE
MVNTNGVVTTFAGTGLAGYNGDGIAATNADLYYPEGVACDSFGNVYIADTYNNRLRRVDSTGLITTITGNGSGSGLGDGGPVSQAVVSVPSGMAFDSTGDLFFADTGANRVRRVGANGIISTLAGNGAAGYSGDGGSATNASLNSPTAVAVDRAGLVYIADSGNSVIRRVGLDGKISSFAGAAGTVSNVSLATPSGIEVDRSGNVFIADSLNSRIVEVGVDGTVSTVAGNGAAEYSGDGELAANSGLYDPHGLALDALGNLLVADQFNHRIRVIGLAGSPSLTFQSVSSSNSGTYQVVVSDSQGSLTSQLASLTVETPPSIVAPPQSEAIVAGREATFTVGAAGSSPLDYQWFFNGVGIPGATNATLELSGVTATSAGDYSVVVASPYGSATSSVASLSVGVPPVVEAGPANQTAVGGGTAAFQASVNGGGPYNFQWQFNGMIVGSSPALTLEIVTPLDAGDYEVLVTSPFGSATSGVVTLTVAAAPEFTWQPRSEAVTLGSNAMFGATVAGSGPLSYQWQFNGTNLPGANGPDLEFLGVVAGNAGAYKLVATNPYGSVTSAVATLLVGAPPGIAVQPASQPVIAGEQATLSVTASGRGPFTYQWIFNGANLTNGYIVTVAGDGATGYFGDGNAATDAGLYAPQNVAVDRQGNLFIADAGHAVVRKVAPDGLITTFAGDGIAGFAGDGGAATNASFNDPTALAIDSSGNLFIADTGNNLVRKVDTNGIVTTFAGNGTGGFSGDGGPATNASLYNAISVAVNALGEVFIADEGNLRVRKVDRNGMITTFAGNGTSGYSGDGDFATNSTFATITGVASDAFGDLLIVDQTANVVRQVGLDGIIYTVAGNGAGGYAGDGGVATNANLYYPKNVATDPAGNFFIADQANNVVRRVGTNGIITTVAGDGTAGFFGDGGAATSANLNNPVDVAVDSSGNIFIADFYNNVVREVAVAGLPFLTFTNCSAAIAGDYQVLVSNPYGAITSAVASLAIVYLPTAAVSPLSQSVTAGQDAAFGSVAGGSEPLSYQWRFDGANIAGATNSTLVLRAVGASETGAYSLVVANPYGSVTSLVATLFVGIPPSFVTEPSNQSVLAGDSAMFAAQAVGTGPLVYQWLLNGANLPRDIVTTVAVAASPVQGLAVGADGTVYFWEPYVVEKKAPNGSNVVVAGDWNNGYGGDGGLATAASVGTVFGLAIDPSGAIFIADTSDQRVREVDTNGIIKTVAGDGGYGFSGDGGPATAAAFANPMGVALDGDGDMFVVDQINGRIREVGTNGVIETVMSGLSNPQGVAVDVSGNVYVALAGSNVVLQLGTNGVVTVVAGDGTAGYSGDGGAAMNARLNAPSRVAVDAAGNIYVTDRGNHRIRRVNPAGVIATVAGNGKSGFAGDGGSATNALFNGILDLAVDGAGNLYVNDSLNQRVREIGFAGSPSLTIGDVTALTAGNYQLIVTGPYGSVTSAVATLTALTPPFVVSQPRNADAPIGGSATFAAVAGGTPPFAFQWELNGAGIAGATNTSLILSDVTTNNSGRYDLVISNAYGSVTSFPAFLSVGTEPSILAQPVGGTAVVGENASLSVLAGGTGPFAYQWYFDGSPVPEDIINTVAGPGAVDPGFAGFATNAPLGEAVGLAVDALGNLFIGDGGNSVVWKVDRSGMISIVAGNLHYGFAGDGGSATNAKLASPFGVALDGAGNLFIADTENARVRKVDASGTITTVAGNGLYRFAGDGGPATNASFISPRAVDVDRSGNLYITDVSAGRIRKVDPSGDISTFAGNSGRAYTGEGVFATNAGLYSPGNAAVDQSGNVFISDAGHSIIRKVDPNGIITTVAGTPGKAGFSGDGGMATNATLNNPDWVAVDPAGNLFVADSYNTRIRKVDIDGIISTVAGGGLTLGDGIAATNARLNSVISLATDLAGDLFLNEDNTGRVREVGAAGQPMLVLTDVSASRAGVYQVVVTSPFGSATSVLAAISVDLPPLRSSAVTGGVQIEFTGYPGSNYVLQTAFSLAPRVLWQPVFTNAAGPNGVWGFTDTNAFAAPARFYRMASP